MTVTLSSVMADIQSSQLLKKVIKLIKVIKLYVKLLKKKKQHP